MSRKLTRRGMLAGAMSMAGTAGYALAPEVSRRPAPRSVVLRGVSSESEAAIRSANLGGRVGYAVADAATGNILEARLDDTRLPPASTLKVVTAIYGLERLGPTFQFKTHLLARGPINAGRLDGDLILKGGGDPTLDTDRLADLAVALREAGIHEVSGRFLVWRDGLPRGDRIDDEQPEFVGYNPAYGGLNLNFNRVHFEWERQKDQNYDVTMQARAVRFRPATNVSAMEIVDRAAPVFDYVAGRERDRWSVAKKALGRNGARWLPVRFPGHYAADAFRTLARSNGVVLREPEFLTDEPSDPVLATVESAPLAIVLTDMLKHSTNLTAEIVGLSSSVANGVPVGSLLGSGSRMAGWAIEAFGRGGAQFRDHSGLGYGSVLSAQDMVHILVPNGQIAPLLKPFKLALDKNNPAPSGVEVRAKTGTLNFVSSLAGYVKTTGGRELCFAIFTADTERRDAIPPEARERPKGAKGWSRRSRTLQKKLIRGWAAQFG